MVSLDSSDADKTPAKQKVSKATQGILSPAGAISQQTAPIAPMTGSEKRKSFSPRSKAPLISSEKIISDRINSSGADATQINPGSGVSLGWRSVNPTMEADNAGLPQSLVASRASALTTEHNISDIKKSDARDKDKQQRTPNLPNARFGPELAGGVNGHSRDRSASLEDGWKTLQMSPSQSFKPLPRHETPSKSTEPIFETRASAAPTVLEADPGKQSPQPPPLVAPKPRAKTQIPFWIITRDPLYTEERWDDGKFTGTSLLTFLEGISKVLQRPVAHIEKIKLTLQTPMSHTKITVRQDAEDSWVEAKVTFVEKLKEVRRLARGDMTGCKILVEPLWEEGVEANSGFEDEDEGFEI